MISNPNTLASDLRIAQSVDAANMAITIKCIDRLLGQRATLTIPTDSVLAAANTSGSAIDGNSIPSSAALATAVSSVDVQQQSGSAGVVTMSPTVINRADIPLYILEDLIHVDDSYVIDACGYVHEV
jgi:hypothetical protein